jgi:hypothetical protein
MAAITEFDDRLFTVCVQVPVDLAGLIIGCRRSNITRMMKEHDVCVASSKVVQRTGPMYKLFVSCGMLHFILVEIYLLYMRKRNKFRARNCVVQ